MFLSYYLFSQIIYYNGILLWGNCSHINDFFTIAEEIYWSYYLSLNVWYIEDTYLLTKHFVSIRKPDFNSHQHV